MGHSNCLLAILVAVAAFAGCGSDGFDSSEFEGSGGGGSAGDAGIGAQGGSGVDGGSAATAGSAGSAGGDAASDAETDAQIDVATDSGGGQAGEGGTSDAGVDAPPACADPLGEPNETENAAVQLAGVDDCDATKKTVGILAPGGDQDWYVYGGSDNLLTCSPNPKATVTKAETRVCVFAQCSSGTTQVVCAKGTAEKSPANRQGCCATAGTAELTLSCSGLGAKNASVHVRIDQPGKDACVDYELVYSY